MRNRKVLLVLAEAVVVVSAVGAFVIAHLLGERGPQIPSQPEYEDRSLLGRRQKLRAVTPEELSMTIGEVPAGTHFFVPAEALAFEAGRRGSVLGRKGLEAERAGRPLFEIHKTRPTVDGLLLIGYVGEQDRQKLGGARATVSLYPRRTKAAASLKVVDLWRIESASVRQEASEDGKSLPVLVVTVVSVG